MLEEKALQHRCPRRVDSNGQLEYCYGSECMACSWSWSDSYSL